LKLCERRKPNPSGNTSSTPSLNNTPLRSAFFCRIWKMTSCFRIVPKFSMFISRAMLFSSVMVIACSFAMFTVSTGLPSGPFGAAATTAAASSSLKSAGTSNGCVGGFNDAGVIAGSGIGADMGA
jgi:hypothetical protein